MKLNAKIITLVINLQIVWSALLEREGRLLGGAGFHGSLEIYDCPCGCNITSIQGQIDKQHVAPDQRCNSENLSIAKIDNHLVDCPCGCLITIESNTTVIINSNKKCAKSNLSKIDEVHLLCPCSCTGTTSNNTYYELPRTSRCPIPESLIQSPTGSVTGEQSRNVDILSEQRTNIDNDGNHNNNPENDTNAETMATTTTTTRTFPSRNNNVVNLSNRSLFNKTGITTVKFSNLRNITSNIFKFTTKFPSQDLKRNKSSIFNSSANRFVNRKSNKTEFSLENKNHRSTLQSRIKEDKNATAKNTLSQNRRINSNLKNKTKLVQTAVKGVADSTSEQIKNGFDLERTTEKEIDISNTLGFSQKEIDEFNKLNDQLLNEGNILPKEVTNESQIDDHNRVIPELDEQTNEVEIIDKNLIDKNNSTLGTIIDKNINSEDVEFVPVISANQDIKSMKSFTEESDMAQRLVIHPNGPIKPKDILDPLTIK